MHRIDIIIGTENQYTEFAENFGKAIKAKNAIVRNGYEVKSSEKGVATHYPPHRIQRIDIYPVIEPEEKKDVGEEKDTETRKENGRS